MPVTVDVIETEILLRRDALSPALQKIVGLASMAEAKVAQLTKAAGMLRLPPQFLRELTGATTAAGKLRDSLGTIRISPAATTGAETLSRRLGTAEARAAALSRTLGTLKMPHLGMLPTAGGGGGHGGSGGGLRGRMHTGPFAAHFGVGPGAAAGLGLGFGAYEGVKLAAKEQLGYIYAALASGMDPTSARGQQYLARLRQVAEDASFGTVFTRADVAKMMPGVAGMADVPLDKALPFMKPAIQFGEVERQFGAAIGKNFGAGESAAAAIRMAHMLGITDPAAMTPVLNAMVPASTTTEKSPEELTRVLQYMLGSAAGVGMSQAESINLGALGGILMPGTRAGTSLNMMLTGMMPKGGAGAGTRIHKGAAQRKALLQRMGLIDPKTHQLFRDSEGGMLVPMVEHLQGYLKTHPTTAYGDFVGAFQQRGARMAFELARNPKMVDMARELETRQTNFVGMGGVTGVQSKQNEALSNQALRAWSNIKTVMTDLAEGTLPGLTAALKSFNTGLEATRTFLEGHKGAATAAGWGAEAAGGVGALWALKRLGGFAFGRGAASAAGGALTGAASGAAGAASVGIGAAAVGAMPWLALGAGAAWIKDKLGGPSDLEGRQDQLAQAREDRLKHRTLWDVFGVSNPFAGESPKLPPGLGVPEQQTQAVLTPEQRRAMGAASLGVLAAAALKEISAVKMLPAGVGVPEQPPGMPSFSLPSLKWLWDSIIPSAGAAELPLSMRQPPESSLPASLLTSKSVLPPPSGSGGPGGGADLGAIREAVAAGMAAGVDRVTQGMQVQLTGQVNLTGDANFNMGELGNAVAHMIARGIAHAVGGAMTSGGARPDFSGGPALHPPT